MERLGKCQLVQRDAVPSVLRQPIRAGGCAQVGRRSNDFDYETPTGAEGEARQGIGSGIDGAASTTCFTRRKRSSQELGPSLNPSRTPTFCIIPLITAAAAHPAARLSWQTAELDHQS
jgi:hypothetical protein